MSSASPYPLYDWSAKLIKEARKSAGIVLSGEMFCVIFSALIFVFFLFAPAQSVQNFEVLIFLSPLWLPFMLMGFAREKRLELARALFHVTQKKVLLELRVPRDTRKSPQAMETFFTNLALAPGESTWYKRMIQGRTRPWWSLELVSTEGEVHFYIWTWEIWRRPLESFLYAQYPGAELIEATDYSRLIDPSHEPNKMWTVEYAFSEPDAFPISSYIDFGLEKNPKPEEQVDPIAQVIEVLNSIGKGEHIWIQIMIQGDNAKSPKFAGKLNKKGKPYTIIDEGEETIEKIRRNAMMQYEEVDPTGKKIKKTLTNPTKGQLDMISDISRKIYKPCYDVGMRAIYFADKDHFKGTTPGAVGSIWKPFGGSNKIGDVGGSNDFFGYPWEDPGRKREAHMEHHALLSYRRRAYFYPPFVGTYMIMSAEELATIFHIPSSTVASGGFTRIQSATSGAPGNLPT